MIATISDQTGWRLTNSCTLWFPAPEGALPVDPVTVACGVARRDTR
jgi:hypothetical protein